MTYHREMGAQEITEDVDLCLPGGKLNPQAVGFTRKPLHRSNLRGWGRNKRWDYWGIVSPRFVLGMTVADLDYAHLSQLYLYDREDNREIVTDAAAIGPGDVLLPDGLPPLVVMEDNDKTKLRFLDESDQTILKASSKHLEVNLTVGPGGESLGVVVPWSKRRFQYTLKDVARPVSGTIAIDGTTHDLNARDSFAVLDRGRGKWPYAMTWNWATGSGITDGKRLGLQMGGKWTDGTGVTENGIFVDGRLTYWGDELEWSYEASSKTAPWHVCGERVDATLTPFHLRHASSNFGLIASSTYQAFGTWTGHAVDEAGIRHSLDGLTGWAEQAKNRW